MEGTAVGYLVAIIFLVLALNLYITFRRISRTNKSINKSKKSRLRLDEEKHAIWRDKEIARRIAREQEDAIERVHLRNETLAFYEEVRRRHVFNAEYNNDRINVEKDSIKVDTEDIDAGIYIEENDSRR